MTPRNLRRAPSAERLGWISDGQAWFDARQLRNRMIHEHVRDPKVLASALSTGHAAVPLLVESARKLARWPLWSRADVTASLFVAK